MDGRPFILLPEYCYRPSAGGSSRRQMPQLVFGQFSTKFRTSVPWPPDHSAGDVELRTMQLVVPLPLPTDKEAL
jgi:hypothetical protein